MHTKLMICGIRSEGGRGMRPLLSTELFILAGLAAVAIGFYPAFVGEPVVQDDDNPA